MRRRRVLLRHGNGAPAVFADELNDARLAELGVWLPCSEEEFEEAPLPVKTINGMFHLWVPFDRLLSPDRPEDFA